MLTKSVLKDFTYDELVDLMTLKLEELKQLGDQPKDLELYYLTRVEIDLITKVIAERA
jgi:hypothetical protein